MKQSTERETISSLEPSLARTNVLCQELVYIVILVVLCSVFLPRYLGRSCRTIVCGASEVQYVKRHMLRRGVVTNAKMKAENSGPLRTNRTTSSVRSYHVSI
jgi:hypothetical protein